MIISALNVTFLTKHQLSSTGIELADHFQSSLSATFMYSQPTSVYVIINNRERGTSQSISVLATGQYIANYSNIPVPLFSPQKRGSMFLPVLVCLSVCLSVTMITKKDCGRICTNFRGRFLGEREDQVRVSLWSVEGCGSNGHFVNQQLFAFYTSKK